MALATREVICGGLVHHSDRGVQYARGDYIARLEQAGILPSMSRAGYVRQRHGRELHEDAQGRGSRRPRLPRPRRRQDLHRRLHRDGLQPPATALGAGLSLTGRVRGGSRTAVDGEATHRAVDCDPAAHSFNNDCLQFACLKRGVHSRLGHQFSFRELSPIFPVSLCGSSPYSCHRIPDSKEAWAAAQGWRGGAATGRVGAVSGVWGFRVMSPKPPPTTPGGME